MVAVTSSHRDRAFYRTKSSACLPASTARLLPPPRMGTPPTPLPGSTSPSGFARCGAKADRCRVASRHCGVREGAEFCADPIGLRQLGCVIPLRQRLPDRRAGSRSVVIVPTRLSCRMKSSRHLLDSAQRRLCRRRLLGGHLDAGDSVVARRTLRQEPPSG